MTEDIYDLLKQYKAAWVISDSTAWERKDIVTSNFVYIRMHGPKSLFSSLYSKEDVKKLAKLTKKYLKDKKKVFIYFNNDAYGYAVKNAKELIREV